ncbi:hypothetical protein [Actinokineospora sp. NBRC 105648]|uniref:hypothetical protein n=1 Tax=Actinokineospora sp. NBRC 105648 TaxID=3032206 RepID=UPI0024A35AAF|nr:hypothetical protein [Actinokineospora sp. NBRC 105648]GLZ39845.1 hypothetical protein Acsp05_34690 [Actinokineospora sp. NBRC 105648]
MPRQRFSYLSQQLVFTAPLAAMTITLLALALAVDASDKPGLFAAGAAVAAVLTGLCAMLISTRQDLREANAELQHCRVEQYRMRDKQNQQIEAMREELDVHLALTRFREVAGTGSGAGVVVPFARVTGPQPVADESTESRNN